MRSCSSKWVKLLHVLLLVSFVTSEHRNGDKKGESTHDRGNECLIPKLELNLVIIIKKSNLPIFN